MNHRLRIVNKASEWYTCKYCGQIRSTTDGPCRHWRLDRDGWPHSGWSAHMLWTGALTVGSLLGWAWLAMWLMGV